MISDSERIRLIDAATGARGKAHAPYSKFNVGAAVIGTSGVIYAGCNIENASYSLTVCAERNAVFKAVSEGERRFKALALCIEGGASPCGACLQVIHEFAPNILILIFDPQRGGIRETTLDRLLPDAFS